MREINPRIEVLGLAGPMLILSIVQVEALPVALAADRRSSSK